MKRDDGISGSVCSQQSTDDWGLILQECRRQRMHLDDYNTTKEDWASFVALFESYHKKIERQLSIYCERLETKKTISSGDGKVLIQNTRNALRIAVSFFSIPDVDSRESVQNSSIDYWAESVFTILCSQRGDAKCRLFAAQLLSNMVTQNAQTAQAISSLVIHAPSTSDIYLSLRDMTVSSEEKDVSESSSQAAVPNWVDMLLAASKSNNREALAAIVAALHNMFSSGVELSTNSLLVSTIMRQLIAADSIKGLIHGGSSDDEMTDVATEWIVILIAKYCREGKLSSLYKAASGIDKSLEKCLPEQVVLLHCVKSIVEDPADPANDRYCRLGSGSGDGSNSIKTHVFLAELLAVLLSRTLTQEQNAKDEEMALVCSASSTILDILAETFASDSEEMATTRVAIGQDTELLSVASLRNNGRNARETVIHDDEQAVLVGLVRLLGNLAFDCKRNQDALRRTVVPLPASEIHAAYREERSGLHVLLSCTAYSHACFTLREWAVVAIRNVLENNAENQELVERLEAKQGVQSTVVNDMGIQIDVEPKSGKVEIKPLDKINE